MKIFFYAILLTYTCFYNAYTQEKKFIVKNALVDVFSILEEYEISYKYDPILKKLTIDNNINIISGNEYYKDGNEIKKANKKPESKSDAFYIPSHIVKNIFDNKLEIVEEKRGSLTIKHINSKPVEKTFTTTKVINESKNNKIEVIIIDAGHGGRDPGSIGVNNIYEKDIVLPIALMLEKEIKAILPNVKIVMTRTNDTFYTLYERAEIANKKALLDTDTPKNSLFISLHANASFSKSAKGFEVFFLSAQESSEYARAVSMFENNFAVNFESSSFGKYTNYSQTSYYYMLIEQYQKESRRLAQIIVDNAQKIKGVSKRSVPVNSALFWVLKGSVMPAVLVELGFITNAEDAKLLKSSSFQKEISKSIAKSIKTYIEEFEKTKGFTQ